MHQAPDFTNHTAEDFALEASFQSFVLAADEADIAFWKKWIALHPEKQDEITEAIKLLDALYARLPQDEMAAGLNEFITSIKVENTRNEKHAFIGQGHPWPMTRFLRYAAMLAFFIIAGFLTYSYTRHLWGGEPQDETVAKMVEKSTTRGQKSIITLKDGTQIRLNAESKIRFPENFSDSTRMVTLEGEAYFEVARDPTRPFIVECGGLYTKVLGTSFNINAYPENKKIAVDLVEGKVLVYGKNAQKSSLYLLPDQQASYDKDDDNIQLGSFNPKEATAWKDGIIRFNKASFEEMRRVLERWYDVKFEIVKNPVMTGFTGEFQNQSLDAVLKGIGFSVGFKFQIEGRKVIID